MNYSRFINALSAARRESPIRRLSHQSYANAVNIIAASGPDLISFGAGAPNAKCFPITSLNFKDNLDNEYTLEDAKLHFALQYSQTPGILPLRQWLRELQLSQHDPPTARMDKEDDRSMDIMVVPGSQDGLCKLLELTLEKGDSIILEEPAYPGTLAPLRPLGVTMLSCATDDQGTSVSSLRALIAANPSAKVLYLQPNACNPTGVTTEGGRRKEIYKIACEHDLLIIEDDPYRYLLFETPPPSYLSMDTEGRVVRLDSFSKIMSSGIRLGVVTGPKAILQQITLHLQVGSMHCSTLSQVLALELLNKMKLDGFLAHTTRVAAFYESQCDLMLAAADKHLKDLCTWNRPRGGMFLWMTAKHVADTQTMIEERALDHNVILLPGNAFMIDDEATTPHLRASFSAVDEQQMDKVCYEGEHIV